ncbi:MAG: hypothetical protein HCAMLNBO_00229 [Candidatus Brocadia fulgida]|nr:hypothetical protein [Candidatus Brocadia fulgida]
MKIKDDRLVRGEQAVEFAFRRPVRMLGYRLQFEQIHHVNKAQLQIRLLLAQDGGCCQCLHGGDVAAGG